MNEFTYPAWAKIYTVWMTLIVAIALLILDMVWIHSPHPEAYLWILLLVVIQYFFTEFRAPYWPICISDEGLVFRNGKTKYSVRWCEIDSITEFPTKDYQPYQWSESIFSSGMIITTKEQKEFVIYKKIAGYESILEKCNENT